VRLLLSQFKEAGGPLEIDRSLDAEDLDAEFARVARALNGGLGPENLDPAFKFSTGMLSEPRSILALSGTREYASNPATTLGVIGDASWIPVRLEVASFVEQGGVWTPTANSYELKIGATVAATFTATDGRAVVTAFAGGPFAADAPVSLRHTSGLEVAFRVVATISFAVLHTT
jgi:hypothetical protein